MITFLLISQLLLWMLAAGLVFLLLGALRGQALLAWRLEQLEATTPRRLGRDGLKLSTLAPDFSLDSVSGEIHSLAGYRGRQLLVVFSQCGCGPCHEIVPELNRLHAQRSLEVVVINHGTADDVRQWAEELRPHFPVLIQPDWEVSKRFEVFATPFGFVLDETGLVIAKGIVSSPQYLGFVLADARRHHRSKRSAIAMERISLETPETKELSHAQ